MDVRSKGKRRPGFYLRTKVGMTGPVVLGRASRTPLPLMPHRIRGHRLRYPRATMPRNSSIAAPPASIAVVLASATELWCA